MTRERDKQRSGEATYADDIARGRTLTPGKNTRVDDVDAPPVYNVLTPAERAKMITDLRFRIVAGGARSDIAITKLEILTLLKKPADMPVALSLLYDGALTAITMWAGKTLAALKNRSIAKHDRAEGAAVELGDLAAAEISSAKRDAIRRITDDDIKLHVGTLSGFARFQGRGSVAAAFADTSDKRATLEYLPQLQKHMGKAFQQLNEGAEHLSDAELIVLHQAMDSDNTTIDGWYHVYESKTQRWKASDVNRIGHDRNILESKGKGDWVGHEDIDRKVVWVMHEDHVTKSLWFYESTQTHLPATFLHGRADASRLTKPVPQEFWREAELLNEARHGEPVQTLPDSGATRKARSSSPEVIQRRADDKRKADEQAFADTQRRVDEQRNAADERVLAGRTVRLFGANGGTK